MVEIVSVSGMAAKALSGLEIDLPVICRLGMIEGKVVAAGGLAFGGGRCWLFFDIEEDCPKHVGLQALRQAKVMLRKAAQLGETEVYTPRNAAYETSERLCKMAGFEKTDEVLAGQEIWVHKWRHSH